MCQVVLLKQHFKTCKKNNIFEQEGYEGDGRTCNLAAECRTSAECTDVNSFCNQGVCECAAGFERDNSDLYDINPWHNFHIHYF